MSKLCCIKGCDLPVEAMGMCVNHWRMNRKHGSPIAQRPLSAQNRGMPAEERFWRSVQKTAGCWLWKGGRDQDGYGIFRAEIFGVRTHRAHRFSHMLATGELLDPNQVVMHSCDNPQCVNPAHLSSGTPAENTADMLRKGRHIAGSKSRELHARTISRLTDDQVRAICRDARPYREIAEQYGIHYQHVWEIKHRTTRFFVEVDPSEIVLNKRGARGAKRSKNLTDQDVRDIRENNAGPSVLARKYGVSASTICDIRARRSWTHIE